LHKRDPHSKNSAAGTAGGFSIGKGEGKSKRRNAEREANAMDRRLKNLERTVLILEAALLLQGFLDGRIVWQIMRLTEISGKFLDLIDLLVQRINMV